MSDGLIPLSQMVMYDYDYEDKNGVVRISIEIPSTFNVDIIKAELNDEKNSIFVHASDDICPFLCGRLYGTATALTRKFENGKLIIELTKAEDNEPWNILITSNHTENKMIDPKSAFAIYNLYLLTLSQHTDNSNFQIATQYLQFAASAGYIPALREYGQNLLKAKETFVNGVELLKVCCDKYKDPKSAFCIAIVLAQTPQTAEQGFPYMKFAADAGFPDAIVGLGEYYSPLSSITYEHKDPEKAMHCFETAISLDKDNWIAYHELGKLTFHGIGTKQNTTVGIELQRKAKSLNPNVPPIEINDQRVIALKNPEPKTNDVPFADRAIIIGATAAVALGFGALIYRAFRRGAR